MSQLAASYRDPSGFIFKENEIIKRQINPIFFEEYQAAVDAGIYTSLFEKGWLVRHKETYRDSFKIILLPEQIPFITYPYEWSFSQYKHAAQLTLRIQMFLLSKGFTLKDASAFNVTFYNGKAIFIDTLSIERYKPSEPWRALQQFEMHFFSVLLLSQKYGANYLKTLSSEINGKSLKETSKLLDWKTKFHPVIYPNIHLMAKGNSEQRRGGSTEKIPKISKASQLKILTVLESHISSMSISEPTEWAEYYDQTNYDPASFDVKKQLIRSWSTEINATKAIDLGGNDGTFSRELPESVNQIIVTDIDQAAIDHCYKTELTSQNKSRIIPMVCDLMQPSPALGFANEERESFICRVQNMQPDLSLALALIHHITLTGNVPFEMSAAFFTSLSEYLIIEFPDRKDSWVQFILDSKRDARHLFEGYGISAFAKAFSQYYHIEKQELIPGTHRTLFLMRRK
ncbi:class I SAM-dependent methyltransferase [Nonlabens antarcticus]|uniref:class I SAM-dependent methyltransferase n=1 Tax=Nonlabens antarcticus TaxID=392714 RepID=UPI001891C5F4|nr:class I SAM-dependent methyltransferase [Nonlabens antarcticus]